MKTLALHRAGVLPQLPELLPGGMTCPSNQSQQQNNRQGETV
jgi:hypothetical protein